MRNTLVRLKTMPWLCAVSKNPRKALILLFCLVPAFQIIRVGYGVLKVRAVNAAVERVLSSEEEKGKSQWSVPPPPNIDDPWQQRPNYSFEGVVGNLAIINGRQVKVGDLIGSATLEAVGIDSVKIKKEDGQVQEFKLFETLQIQNLVPTPTPTPAQRKWRQPEEILQSIGRKSE